VFPELASLLRKTSGAAELIAQALGPLNPRLALIFGSVARGTETAGSDLDLLIVTESSFGAVVGALHEAQSTLSREINPVVYSAAELRAHIAEREPFVQKVLAEPYLLLKGSLDDFGEPAGHPAPAGV
jgi:predicted nucleotidyltransferase